MAFMCRSARVQRWSAGAAKKPLFQTPTVPENCKGASLHTSAYFLQLHYHKSVFQHPCIETLFPCLYKSVICSVMQYLTVYINLHHLHWFNLFLVPEVFTFYDKLLFFFYPVEDENSDFHCVRMGTHWQPPCGAASHHIFWQHPSEHKPLPILKQTVKGKSSPFQQGAIFYLP